MAPCRQLLIWSVPSIAVLLGLFWFRRKREFAKSDPGGREKIRSLQEELAEVLRTEAETASDARPIVKSSPIDIVANGSQRSSFEFTDEEVEFEIENIIRKKHLERERKSLSNSSVASGTPEPVAAKFASVVAESSPLKRGALRSPTTPRSGATPRSSLKQTEMTLKREPLIPRDQNVTSVDAEAVAACPASPLNVEILQNRLDTSEEVNNNSDAREKMTSSVSESEKCVGEQQTRRSSERDSANHSPASMCHFSDNHSEGSTDSGKGCSEAASPPPAGLSRSPDRLRIHQFLVPQTLCGMLIGKQGAFVTQIKAKTGASVFVKRHPDWVKLKVCAVEGTQTEIEAALEMIRRKFPQNEFPDLSLQDVSADNAQRLIPVVPEFLRLQLVESVNNETIMTCLVSAGHFFLQQPLHPTFPSLQALHRLMAHTYQCPDVPGLPRPIQEGSICAAPTENNWYRAQVVSTSPDTDTSVVMLVDFGGYLTLDNSLLKQIRSDFMTLPFQATEALLAFVKPANGAEEWCGEALRIMAAMTAGQLLYAQVAGYDESGIPLTQLYLTIGAQQVIHLNSELVGRGLAEWDLPQEL